MKNATTIFIKSEPHRISHYTYDFFKCTHVLTGAIFYARKKRRGKIYTSVAYAKTIDAKKWESGLNEFLNKLS